MSHEGFWCKINSEPLPAFKKNKMHASSSRSALRKQSSRARGVHLDPCGGWRRNTVALTCSLRLNSGEMYTITGAGAGCTADAGSKNTQTSELCKLSDVLHDWRWSCVTLTAGESAACTAHAMLELLRKLWSRRAQVQHTHRGCWSDETYGGAGDMHSSTGADATRPTDSAAMTARSCNPSVGYQLCQKLFDNQRILQ